MPSRLDPTFYPHKGNYQLMQTFKRVSILIVAGLSIGLTAGAVATSHESAEQSTAAHSRTQLMYVTDFSDPRRLVGAVDNVFVGRVAAQVGATVIDDEPETQFQVEVLENIKGSLKGDVIVNQQGGVDGEQLVIVEDDALLLPGKVYVFATSLYKESGWHTPVPGYGDILIKDAKHRDALVKKFQQATQEQVPFTRPAAR